MSGGIFDSTVGSLNTSLNLRLMNQNVIASNIANADTPGYKAQRLEFETALRDLLGVGDELKLETTHPDHFGPNPTQPVHPEIYDVPNDVHSLDGNSVDRAKEMARMAENQLMYDASAEMLRRKLTLLKTAISDEGGR